MSNVLIGSAKTGKIFSVKQVSVESYYTHKQGYWLGFKPKYNQRELANAMQEACDNNHILYNQTYREQAWKKYNDCHKIANIKELCYTDCSALVRLCIRQAFNKELPNFNTESEPQVLKNSGLFEPPVKITSASQCTLGMVLVSPKKGHTVIVVEAHEAKHSSSISRAKDINMIKLCDIREYVLKFMTESDLNAAAIFAKKYNLEKAIYYTLYYLNEVYCDSYEVIIMKLLNVNDDNFFNTFGDSTLSDTQQFKKDFWERFRIYS